MQAFGGYNTCGSYGAPYGYELVMRCFESCITDYVKSQVIGTLFFMYKAIAGCQN